MTHVRFESANGVATITLDGAATLNALTSEAMSELVDALRRVELDETIRVAVLTGEGRGFCSGADLSESAGGEAEQPTQPTDTSPFVTAMRMLDTLPVPTIARINGVAAGGGVGLAIACDIAIAARSASFNWNAFAG